LIEFLGLDNTVAAVYRALLSARGSPADLSVATGFPESAIRDALGVLAALRLARAPADTTSDDWQALRPDLGFAAQVRRHEEELARLTHQLTLVRAAAAAAAAATAAASLWSARLRHTAAPLELLETTQDALAETYRLAEHATTEYLQVMPAPPDQLGVVQSGLYLHEAAAARGVALKALYHDSAHGHPKALAHAQRAAQAGAEVRTAPLLPPPMVICDRQIAMIPAAEEQPETALRIRDPAIVAVLRSIFASSWDTAAPLAASITPDQPTDLTLAERTLLQLLAAGQTDEAAASNLQRSLSTISRQKKVLMRKLQAASSFQAGVNAAKKGWL
jgi:DNA-binding NarL/FixJ family response regulator